MSLLGAPRALWTRAPAWRWSLIGACVLTLVAVLKGGPSTPPPPVPCAPGETRDPVSGSCILAPPSPTPPPSSSGCPQPGGQVASQPLPPNVVQVAQAPPSPDALARVADFMSRTTAADAQARQGERCVEMAAALDRLEPTDLAILACEADGMKKHAKAVACSGELAASDQRFEQLQAAYLAYGSDRTAPVVARLARAAGLINDFDRSRNRHLEFLDAVEAGAAAKDALEASERRITALESAAGAGDGGPAVEALGRAASEITAFDSSRMNERQRAALEAGRTAAERVAHSDRRIADLGTAYRVAASSTDPGMRQDLIDAVAAIEDFDLSRATPDQQETIRAARDGALTFAKAALAEVSAGIDLASASVQQHETLANLKRVIDEQGGLGGADAALTAAYQTADRAAARLASSDARIARMREVIDSWRRDPAPALEAAVIASHGEIDSFDRARLQGASADDYAGLGDARQIIDAMHDGLNAETREVATLFVTPGDDSPETRLAADALRSALSREGYRIVDMREQSALLLELFWGGDQRQTMAVGSSTVQTATVSLSLVGGWTYRDEPFLRSTVQGEGRSFSPSNVVEKGIDDAVAKLVEVLNSATSG
jgi:hypothetical protein